MVKTSQVLQAPYVPCAEQVKLAHLATGLTLDQSITANTYQRERSLSPNKPPQVEQQTQPSISQAESKVYQETKQPSKRMPTRELVKLLKERMGEESNATTPDKIHVYEKERPPQQSESPTDEQD